MEDMRRIAFEVVSRACLFGSLAIFCVMIGMSFDARLAFQAGGFLTTLMAVVLIYKAIEARTKDYRRTEMWLYLEKNVRPPAGLCAMGERHGVARDLYDLCTMDLGYRNCDVGHSATLRIDRSIGTRPHRFLRDELQD
jgi:hypothetical protein